MLRTLLFPSRTQMLPNPPNSPSKANLIRMQALLDNFQRVARDSPSSHLVHRAGNLRLEILTTKVFWLLPMKTLPTAVKFWRKWLWSHILSELKPYSQISHPRNAWKSFKKATTATTLSMMKWPSRRLSNTWTSSSLPKAKLLSHYNSKPKTESEEEMSSTRARSLLFPSNSRCRIKKMSTLKTYLPLQGSCASRKSSRSST